MKQSFRKLLDAQKGLVKELDSLVGEFEASDFVNQNISLQKELENFKKLNEELKKNYYQARKENDSLRAALKEQILDEKLNILRISKKKMEAYFQDMSEKYNNGLIALEHSAAERLANMKLIASRELGNEKEAFIKEAERLFLELQSKIKAKIQNQAAEKQKALDEISESYSRLESKDISEEEIQKRVRQNNLEVKIGLNLINKAGILLILIGIATGLGYSYKFLSPALKGIFAFVIGGLFLAAGELFSRKEKSAVALGFTGGGIGILYLAIFNCYFVLHIIEMPIALLLSVLVTAAAFTFSLVYDSKTICSLALAGGFLPFFSYSFSHEMAADAIYIAMVYLFILNLLTMSISLFKKWDIANYISFILNVPTLIYLISLVPHEGASILYSILTFSMYLVVILAYPFRHKTGLKAVDSIFLGLNTAISCTIIFSLFEASKATVLGDLRLKDFKGLLAVMFCLIYFGLGQFVEKKMSSEKFARVLFYLTSFTFAVLMIPFQFGVKWLAMGWLVEGVLMIAYGFSNKLKGLETGGWIVYALCSLVFFAAEFLPFVLLGERTNPNLFYFKYSAIIAGSLCILFVYLYDMAKDASAKYTTRGQLINLFKYFSIITLWIYMAYMAHEAYNIFVKSKQLNNSLYQTFTFAFVTLLAGYIITRLPWFYDKVVKYFSIALYIIADLICIAINLSGPVFLTSAEADYFTLVVLLVFNVFAFLSVSDIVLSFVRKGAGSLEFYPLFMGLYLLGIITSLLVVQVKSFVIADINVITSLVFLIFAFFYIIYGFNKHYSNMRRLGLGLSIFSTAKLFIFDLRFLDAVGRIISYFAFGLVLIGISLVYQRFKKSMEGLGKETQV